MNRQQRLDVLDRLETAAENEFFENFRVGTLAAVDNQIPTSIFLQVAQLFIASGQRLALDLRPAALSHPSESIRVLCEPCVNVGCTPDEIGAGLMVAWNNAQTRYKFYRAQTGN